MGELAKTRKMLFRDGTLGIAYNGSGIAAVWEIEVRQHKFITKAK